MGSSLLANDSLLNNMIKALALLEIRLKTSFKIHVSHEVRISVIWLALQTEGNERIIFSNWFSFQSIEFPR